MLCLFNWEQDDKPDVFFSVKPVYIVVRTNYFGGATPEYLCFDMFWCRHMWPSFVFIDPYQCMWRAVMIQPLDYLLSHRCWDYFDWNIKSIYNYTSADGTSSQSCQSNASQQIATFCRRSHKRRPCHSSLSLSVSVWPSSLAEFLNCLYVFFSLTAFTTNIKDTRTHAEFMRHV